LVDPRDKENGLLEIKIEEKVCKWAKANCILHCKYKSPTQRDLPDRQFIFPSGIHAYIEFKRRGKEPTATQYIEINRMKKYNCNVEWFDNSIDSIEWLSQWL